MIRHLLISARIALQCVESSRKIQLKAGRELVLQNMLNFDAFELVDELPPRKYFYDMVNGEVTK